MLYHSGDCIVLCKIVLAAIQALPYADWLWDLAADVEAWCGYTDVPWVATAQDLPERTAQDAPPNAMLCVLRQPSADGRGIRAPPLCL